MAKKDALEKFTEEANKDPRKAIALLLWIARHRNADLAALITAEDIEAFDACCDYLKVKPEVLIVRPKGHPGTPGIPAQGKRRAVPARPAEPPRPYVVVQLVQKGTTDGFKPIENNEEGAKLRDQANQVRRAREQAPQLSAQLMADARVGVFSTATIGEAAGVLQTLARA
jgi:hypothetical protein